MTDKPSDTPLQPKRTAYLVLGMHRSGTSALANLLALAGADLPRDVMPADEHNARGYFEPWRIAVFNDRRLAAAGSAWDDPFAALAAPPADEDVWREEARGLFRAQFGRRRRPLLKDPRVSVLAGLWRSVLEAEGLALRVLIPIRHPLAVAGSLAKRDGFSARKSVMVWCAYMLAAEAASRDLPRAFVDYDALLEDWRPQIAAAEVQLGEPLPALTATSGGKIDAFLSTELRRNAPGGDLSAVGEAGKLASGVLGWLSAAARGDSPARTPLDQAAAWLVGQQALYGDLVSPVSADRAVTRAALADAGARVTFLEHTLEETRGITEELEARISSLYAQLEMLNARIRTLEAWINEKQGQVAAQNTQISEMQAQISGQQAIMAEMQAQISGQQPLIAEMQAQISGQQAIMAEMQAQISGQQAIMAEMQAQISGQQPLIAEMQAQITTRNAIVFDLKGQISDQKALISDQQAQINVSQARISAQEAVIEEMQAQVATRNAIVFDLQGQMSNLQALISDDQARISDQEAQIAKLHSQCAFLRRESDELQGLILRLEQGLQASQECGIKAAENLEALIYSA